jgi:hypothetical protein
MAMFFIAGTFGITGAQPDGDSIRFTPNVPANRPTAHKGRQARPLRSAVGQLMLQLQTGLDLRSRQLVRYL